ncbi:hypothetical protein EDC01DRAFT_632574 [Geopyxis carbonaria]|nr:hypothetical protein EDC01DRAFT_632574 [Geopyxis carbonaria]
MCPCRLFCLLSLVFPTVLAYLHRHGMRMRMEMRMQIPRAGASCASTRATTTCATTRSSLRLGRVRPGVTAPGIGDPVRFPKGGNSRRSASPSPPTYRHTTSPPLSRLRRAHTAENPPSSSAPVSSTRLPEKEAGWWEEFDPSLGGARTNHQSDITDTDTGPGTKVDQARTIRMPKMRTIQFLTAALASFPFSLGMVKTRSSATRRAGREFNVEVSGTRGVNRERAQ